MSGRQEISSGAPRARSAGRRHTYKPRRRRGGRCSVRSRRTAKYHTRGQDNSRDPITGGGVLRGRPSAKATGGRRKAREEGDDTDQCHSGKPPLSVAEETDRLAQA